MSQRVIPIDIEAAASGYLRAKGLTATAPPLSPDFAGNLPFALVTRAGGSLRTRVITEHSVDVDVYASTWQAAQEAASDALSWLLRAADDDLTWTEDGTSYWCPCYSVSPGLPYNNPDPRHPNVPRVTFSATVTTRAFVSEITL